MSKIEITQYLLEHQIHDSEQEFYAFIQYAPRRYNSYEIPKRTSGTRKIAQPTRKLKDYQRIIVSIFENNFLIHDCCMAYMKGKDIKTNALIHSGNTFFLKMDFTDFFNSITPKLFFEGCERQKIDLNWVDKETLEKILFWCEKKYSKELALSIGAPSSPFISNFVMYSFDEALNGYCKNNGITYTRYADDLTFSTNTSGILFSVPDIVRGTLLRFYGTKIKINQFKTAFSSKKHNRHVTGLTITNDNTISIGREKKRYIKHLVHNFIEERITLEDLSYLRGYLGFIKYVEPNFLISLEQKYTQNVIQKIRLGN